MAARRLAAFVRIQPIAPHHEPPLAGRRVARRQRRRPRDLGDRARLRAERRELRQARGQPAQGAARALRARHAWARWQGHSAGGNAHACDGGTDAAALPAWLEARVSKCGVPFHKYAPLREADDPEDDLSEYEKANHANIEANRKKLEELGLL